MSKGRTIAIGDVHGCSAATITALVRRPSTPRRSTAWFSWAITSTVGRIAKASIDQIIALGQRCTCVPLMGNHEEMLLAVLEGGQSEIKFWLTFGGAAALTSYGWKGGSDVRPGDVRSLHSEGAWSAS